jgi:hypothetical protein
MTTLIKHTSLKFPININNNTVIQKLYNFPNEIISIIMSFITEEIKFCKSKKITRFDFELTGFIKNKALIQKMMFDCTIIKYKNTDSYYIYGEKYEPITKKNTNDYDYYNEEDYYDEQECGDITIAYHYNPYNFKNIYVGNNLLVAYILFLIIPLTDIDVIPSDYYDSDYYDSDYNT